MEHLEITAPQGVPHFFGRRPVLVERHAEFWGIRQDQVQFLTFSQGKTWRRIEGHFEELRIVIDLISPKVAEQLEKEYIPRLTPRIIRDREMKRFIAKSTMLFGQAPNLAIETRKPLSRPLHRLAPRWIMISVKHPTNNSTDFAGKPANRNVLPSSSVALETTPLRTSILRANGMG
jgi:hypothetical protein